MAFLKICAYCLSRKKFLFQLGNGNIIIVYVKSHILCELSVASFKATKIAIFSYCISLIHDNSPLRVNVCLTTVGTHFHIATGYACNVKLWKSPSPRYAEQAKFCPMQMEKYLWTSRLSLWLFIYTGDRYVKSNGNNRHVFMIVLSIDD